MLNDIKEIIQELVHKIADSRLSALAVLFTGMFLVLIVKLFNLQIVDGEQYLDEYVQMTEKTVAIPGTRGNIYDRNGYLLAYNEPAYSVTFQDTGVYNRNATMNAMLLKLVRILDAHGYSVQGRLEIGLDERGEMIYTSSSEAARKRFLRDYYGVKSVDDLDDPKGKYPTGISARELFQVRWDRYALGAMKDERGNPVILTDQEALQIVNIRYTLSLSAYKKYETVTITSHVDEETVADILEHMDQMQGVGIEESTVRVYNDSVYFAPIIGYTGKVQEDQLDELRKTNPEYELTDIVGRTGIEASMEAELQGGKGYRSLIVNNVGSIMQVTEETESTTGNDIYLTIDRNLQIGIYHLIEQQLAGIIANKLVNEDVNPYDYPNTSKLPIPVKDAYYQLINNNVLSLAHMSQEDASAMEREIYQQFTASRQSIMERLRYELMSDHATPMKDLPKDMMAYMVYIYGYLSDSSVGIIRRDNIDVNSSAYLAWREDAISLREYLYSGISDSWVDTTQLQVENKYSSADDIYQVLVDYVLGELENDEKFYKRIFRYLINDEVITGRQLCIALYDQGILPYDEHQVQLLMTGGSQYAYTFMKERISNIDITPAQLALDPCTGGVVITDVNTGEVRALVTYPSYDNNLLSGTVDAAYYNRLQDDLSLPLYNNATQAKKAPGSTFKPITAIAGLEEKVITPEDMISCTGRYDDATLPIRCWIYPGFHGPLDVRGGIQNSCNYFFSEVAHRLSTDENGIYSTDKGIETIRNYAAMFGLDKVSGIEISETQPEISTTDPERSAMGQGSHSFSNVQLSRYVAALANRGTVFELSLIDKMTDADGNLVEDFTPQVTRKLDFDESTWDNVQQGMRSVISDGSAKRIFMDLEVDIAGKTGTAEESKTRGNHAFFISYGPYANPDICVTVNIPYGYSSSNAATIGKNVYRFYYGYTDLDHILNTGALAVSDVQIGD
ncbi:MAG: penicillin-binding protein [Lachnospiraceae bacterium]|nr:penicillin-binding protein [Lachnospiraceae bacterium]